MAQAQAQTQAPETTDKPERASAAADHTVKVRIKHGRLLVGRTPAEYDARGSMIRESSDERYAEEGEVVVVSRAWAEKLMKRQFDGYPSTTNNGAPGITPGVVCDSPIEIVH